MLGSRYDFNYHNRIFIKSVWKGHIDIKGIGRRNDDSIIRSKEFFNGLDRKWEKSPFS